MVTKNNKSTMTKSDKKQPITKKMIKNVIKFFSNI